LRFAEFDGVWLSKPFKDLTKINQGLQISISERFSEKVEDSYFYITNEFLKKGSKNRYFIKNPSKSVICTEDDILMTRTGNTGMVVTNVSGVFHNNFFKIAYPDYLNKTFLYYFLTLQVTQNYIKRLAGTSTIPDLNHSDFYRIKMNFPQLPEQKKIASFITEVDTKLSQLTKKKALLENYKKGVMQQIFSQELRFKDGNGNDYGDWEEKKLGEIATITSGSSNRVDSNLTGEYAFFDRSQDIRTSGIYLFDGEAIIVAGEGQEFIPKYFVGKFDLHQRTYSIMDFNKNNGKFLYYLIYKNRHYFYIQAVGSTVKSLRLPMFQKMKIKLPNIKEQTKIANFLSDLDAKIEVLSKSIENTQSFKKGLLQQMFV